MTDPTTSTPTPRRVLVTGAAGAIGVAATRALVARGHFVRGLDVRDVADATESRVGDIADPATVRAAVEGIDTIVHLAAQPDEAPFLEKLLRPNVIGLFNIMDAARHSETTHRIILASSMQTVSGVPRDADRLITAADAAPTNHYALTKIWAEQMGEMYARTSNLAVLAIRIGWLTRNAEEAANMARREGSKDSYLSHDDAGRFFTRTVEAPLEPTPGGGGGSYHTLFALSRPTRKHRVDTDTARRVIGYEAQDVFPQGLPFAFP